jgi:hypothetical protein
LLNITGQVVFREARGYQNGSVPLQGFAPGAYILHITSEDNRYRHVQKLVRR